MRLFKFKVFDRAVQNWAVKMEPRSDTMESGRPCRRIMLSRNNLAKPGEEVDFKQGIMWDIFVRRSTNTRIESYLLETGRSMTRSYEMPFQRADGTGRGASSPYF